MVTVRPLTVADVPAAQRLREQAGWNQSDDDWHRLLIWGPDGCWAAESDTGQVVGTTAVTTYGRRIAWVGMVLVDVDHRRQGIGRALLTHALAHLDRQGIQTVALDSTPEGQPLYASLGFVDAFELERWRGPVRGGRGAGASSLRSLTAADLPALVAYDAPLFGTARGHILAAFHADHPVGCFLAERDGAVVGYALSRPGARAWHLGPLAADDPATAERLASAALGAAAGFSELVFDVVRPNLHAVRLAQALGLAPVRRFIRMTRGAPPPAIDAGRLYTSAGPELG
jgi:GNAT superfamily N-acetyltransferase